MLIITMASDFGACHFGHSFVPEPHIKFSDACRLLIITPWIIEFCEEGK